MGSTVERFTFVAETAVQLMAGAWSGASSTGGMTVRAFDVAEEAWDELCRRFQDDADEEEAKP